MGWDAVIAGELKFPKGKVEEWKKLPALLVDHGWPHLLEVEESVHDEDPTVAEILADAARLSIACFGHYPIDGDVVGLRFLADKSNWWMVSEDAVRILCAAAQAGASGRVIVADASDVWSNPFRGGLVVLEGGKLSVTKNASLSADDKVFARAVIDDVTARGREVAKQIAAKVGSKTKKATKAKPLPKKKAKKKT